MSEWRVYQLNDCDWWVARSLAEAMADYAEQTGADLDDPHELSDADMDRLKFTDCDEDENPIPGGVRTFREELVQRVAHGLSEPEMFASTEI